jgi:hypothetical protein
MAANTTTTNAPEETWHPARLIPVAGIKGQEEQERRATSVLLAGMRAVPKFGHALVCPLGAPRGRITTFGEVQLRDGEGKANIPDGAIVVERGNKQWRALVEVKTGRADLKTDQVTRYIDMAREHNFDALITISNQITSGPDDMPVAVDRRRLRRVQMFHLSWWAIVTEAVLQHRFRGIEDPDQAWILGELIAYLDHENAGAGGSQDMGERWVKVREAARQGTVRAADPEVRVIAERWEHFLGAARVSTDSTTLTRRGRRRTINKNGPNPGGRSQRTCGQPACVGHRAGRRRRHRGLRVHGGHPRSARSVWSS